MRSFEQSPGFRRFDEEPETPSYVAEPVAAPVAPAAPAPGRAPRGPSGNSGMTPEIARAIAFGAEQFGVDEAVLVGMGAIESRNYDPAVISGKVLSPRGAAGMMQFMPETAKRFGIDPTDVAQSAIGAAAYMRAHLDMFGGDYDKAMAAYNWGEGNVQEAVKKWGDKWLDHAPEQTQNYIAYVNQMRGQATPQDPAKLELPEGVKPSEAGGGRGMMVEEPGARAASLESASSDKGQIQLDEPVFDPVTGVQISGRNPAEYRSVMEGVTDGKGLPPPMRSPFQPGVNPTVQRARAVDPLTGKAKAAEVMRDVAGNAKAYEAQTTGRAARDVEIGLAGLETTASGMTAVAQQGLLNKSRDRLAQLESAGQGDGPEAQAERKRIAIYESRMPIAAQGVADAAKRSAEAGKWQAGVIKDMGNAKTWGEAGAAFMRDPVGAILSVTLQSLPQILPGMAAGALGGAAVGVAATGASSFMSEATSGLAEYLQKQGVNAQNPTAVAKFFSDKDALRDGLDYALKGAVPVAALDALSMGMASKMMVPRALLPGRAAREVANIPVQVAAQGAAGGGGEAAKQMLQEGRIDKPGQVLAEVVGEMGSTPGDIIAARRDIFDLATGKTEPAPERKEPTLSFGSETTRAAGLPDVVVPKGPAPTQVEDKPAVSARLPKMPNADQAAQPPVAESLAPAQEAGDAGVATGQGAARPAPISLPQAPAADATGVDLASQAPLPSAPNVEPRGVEPSVTTDSGAVTDIVGRQTVQTGPALTTTAAPEAPAVTPGKSLTGISQTDKTPKTPAPAALLRETPIPGVSQPPVRTELPEVEPAPNARPALLDGSYTGDVLAAPEQPFANKSQANLFRDKNQLKGWEAAPIANGWVLRPTSLEPTIGELRHAGQAVTQLQGLQVGGAAPFAGVTLADAMPADTGRAVGVARVAARSLGINLVPVNGLASDGLYVDNQPHAAFVAADSSKPILFVAGHEVYHALKRLGGSVVGDFEQAVSAYLRPEVVANRQAEEEAGALPGQQMQGRGREEVVADVNGAMWLDPKFWREVMLRSPDLFQKVSAAFMEVATKIRAALTRNPAPEAKQFVTDVDAVRKLVAQMTVDARKGAPVKAGDSRKVDSDKNGAIATPSQSENANSRNAVSANPGQPQNAPADKNGAIAAPSRQVDAGTAARQEDDQGIQDMAAEGGIYASRRWADKKGVPNKSDARPGVNIEVAPNPDDPVAQKWNSISGSQRDRITRLLGDKYIRKALDRMGVRYTLEHTSGGFLGETNPSIVIRSTDKTLSFDRLVEIAKDLGRMLDQQAVIAYDENITEGEGLTTFVKVEPGRSLTQAEVARVFSEIHAKFPKAAGFTLRDGGLVFGNFEGGSDAEFKDGIMSALASSSVEAGYEGFMRRFRSDYLETANGEQSDVAGSETGRDGVWRGERGLGALQGAFREEIRREVEAAIEEPARSTVGLREGTEDLSAYGVQPGTKITVRELAEALDKRAARLGRISDRDFSDRAANEIAETFAAEIAHQLTNDANAETGSGEGWYSSNWPAALRKLSQFFPELGHSRDARALFTMLLAVTSNGERVAVNLGNAITLYDGYVHQGIPLTQVPLGTKMQDALDQNLAELEGLLSRMSVSQANEYLLGTITVSELNVGREKKISDYPTDAVVPMATAIMGPKLGAFYANLMGEEGYLTMDLWWTRSFNRVRGNLLPSVTDSSLDSFKSFVGDPQMSDDEAVMLAIPYQVEYSDAGYKIPADFKGNRDIITIANTIVKNALLEINQAPRGSGEREFMVRVARETVQKLSDRGHNLTIADTQAALWYYEKRLYGELGTRERGDIGYEEAIDLIISDGNRPQRPSADLERFRAQGRNAQDVEPQILRSARPSEPAGGPSDGRGAGARRGDQDARGWSKRSPQPGSVTVEGWHYGKAKVPALSGVMYGSGIKGAEADRLAQSRDRRIKSRVYFYINRDDGTPPPKEDGLGPHKYEQRLSNLYDPSTGDPRIPLIRDGMNEFESAILDAGYDGYIAPRFGMAVVMDATVPANYVGEDKVGPAQITTPVSQRAKKSLMSREIFEVEPLVPRLQKVDPTLKYESGRVMYDPAAKDALNAEMESAGTGIRFSRREEPRPRISLFEVDSDTYESATDPAYRMAQSIGMWTAFAPGNNGGEISFMTESRQEAARWLTKTFDQDMAIKGGRDLYKENEDGAKRAIAGFKALAQVKGAFARPSAPPTKDINRIFKLLSLPGSRFTGVTEDKIGGETIYTAYYQSPGSSRWMAATLSPKQDRDGHKIGYYADTSLLGETGRGADFYQAAFAWAKANKVKLQPDDVLTLINTFRRTEQMLSAALRLGTTKWMNPHLDQRIYGWNENPKNQQEDDENLGRLILATVRNLEESVPEAYKVWYNPTSGKFGGDDGRTLDYGTEVAPLLAAGAARSAGIGRSTLARGLLARDLIAGKLDASSVARGNGADLLGGGDAAEPGTGRAVAGEDAAVRDRADAEGDGTLASPVFYSRRQPPPGGFSIPAPAGRFTLDPESEYMRNRRVVQDRFIRLREVQKMIAEQGGLLNDDNDAYLAEERSHSRVAFAVDEFKDKWMRPFTEKAAKVGIDLDELSLYAYAKHAEERNRHIASINPGLPDGGSGMTTADARAIIARFQAQPNFQDIRDLHNDLMAVTQASRDLLWNEGLISDDEHTAWSNQYNDYIPLRGFEGVDPETGVRTGGRGINVRGKESMRALGRRSRAGNLIENVIADYERAVLRAEKNEIGRTFYRFVQANPDPNLWEVDPVKRARKYDPTKHLVVSSLVEDVGPDTIAFKEDGKEVHIKIHDEALLRTMRGSYMDETGQFQRVAAETLGVFNGYLRNTLTRWNPGFVVINTARDFQTANASVIDKLGFGALVKYNLHVASAAAVAWRNERGTLIPGGGWDKWMTEFRAAGGATGGFFGRDVERIASDLRGMLIDAGATVQPKGSTATAKAIDRAVIALRGNRAAKVAAATAKLVESMGGMSENMFRVAAYRTAREMGKSPAQAASIAKNLTTNFDRRGEVGLFLNSAYLFFNASLQGAVRTLQYAKNPKMAAVAAAGVALGLTAAMLGADAGEEDGESYWDMIPDYIKERNLVIMLPPSEDKTLTGERIGKKGRYIKIPLAYGLNFLPVLGYGLADSFRHAQDHSKGRKSLTSAARVANAFLGSYNPLGGGVPKSVDEAWLMALPTVADIPYTLTQEIDSFGRKAAPEKTRKEEPDSERAFMSDRGTAQHRVARWLNQATGGNKAQSGAIDITPATIEGAVRYASGGTGTFIMDVLSTAGQALGEEKVKSQNVPFLKALYGEVDSKAIIRDFYENRDEIEKSYAQLMAATKMGVPIPKSKQNDALYELGGYLQGIQKGLTELRKWEVDAVSREMSEDPEARKSGKADRERVEAEKAKLMRAFNKHYRKTWGAAE